MSVKGRVAIVTGAGRGMGEADAMLLAKEGAKVVVADINGDNANAVAKKITDAGGEAFAFKVDLTKPEEVDALVQETMNRYGKIDILVSNAGWDELKPFLHTDFAFWNKILELNLKGHMYIAKAVLPHMVKQNYGRIITIGSDAGRLGNPMEAPYSAAKGGVIAFTKTLAREFGRNQITANCVSPGITDTPLATEMQTIIPDKEKAIKMLEAVKAATPLKRIGKVEDVAWAVFFFASDEAGFITGQTLSVSGGLTTI